MNTFRVSYGLVDRPGRTPGSIDNSLKFFNHENYISERTDLAEVYPEKAKELMKEYEDRYSEHLGKI